MGFFYGKVHPGNTHKVFAENSTHKTKQEQLLISFPSSTNSLSACFNFSITGVQSQKDLLGCFAFPPQLALSKCLGLLKVMEFGGIFTGHVAIDFKRPRCQLIHRHQPKQRCTFLRMRTLVLHPPLLYSHLFRFFFPI